MITKERILQLKLHDNFKNFCDNQEDCIRCLLQQEELINEAYDQPCSTIYALLKIIQEG